MMIRMIRKMLLVMMRLMLTWMRVKMTMMIIDMGQRVLTSPSPTSYSKNDKPLLSALWLPR